MTEFSGSWNTFETLRGYWRAPIHRIVLIVFEHNSANSTVEPQQKQQQNHSNSLKLLIIIIELLKQPNSCCRMKLIMFIEDFQFCKCCCCCTNSIISSFYFALVRLMPAYLLPVEFGWMHTHFLSKLQIICFIFVFIFT